MANTSLENNVLMNKLFGGDNAPPPKNPEGDPKKKDVPVNQDASDKFSNWTNSQDTKVAAKDLLDRGLKGADQLFFENQKTGSADDITKKNQSDWKVGAIQKILQKAYQKGIKDPTTFLAPENRDYLLSGLSPDIKAAINDPTFNRIHENFWDVLGNSILPQQWAKEENKNAIAQK